jgi:hypothetical protein
MKRPPPLLLSRLRRHRGLWVLAVAVLLFKLITGSVCLADPPPAASATPGHAALAQAPSSTPDDGGCLLGEGNDCHCACAHNLPVPVGIAWTLPRQEMSFTASPLALAVIPAPSRSLLRPPIAA